MSDSIYHMTFIYFEMFFAWKCYDLTTYMYGTLLGPSLHNVTKICKPLVVIDFNAWLKILGWTR